MKYRTLTPFAKKRSHDAKPGNRQRTRIRTGTNYISIRGDEKKPRFTMHAAATIEPTVRFHLKTCLAHTNEKKSHKKYPRASCGHNSKRRGIFRAAKTTNSRHFQPYLPFSFFFPVARAILIKPDERNQASRKTPAMQPRALPPITKRPLHSSCAVHPTRLRPPGLKRQG